MNIDSIASKLLVFEMENLPILNKDVTQAKIEVEKPNESSVSLAPKPDIESNNKLTERRMSKIDNEKITLASMKDQQKLVINMNSTKLNSNNLIQKISVTSKKFKNNTSSLNKYADVDPTNLGESPLLNSKRIYTQIANSSIQPLNEELSDENDEDLFCMGWLID